jgi:hypothetical protein
MKEDKTVWVGACFEKRADSSALFLKYFTILKPLSLTIVLGDSKLTFSTPVREGVVNPYPANVENRMSS